MTAEKFDAKRRQTFLTERYYRLNQELAKLLTEASLEAIKEMGGVQRSEPASQGSIFNDKLEILKLHYTAGCPIEDLRPRYAEVIRALGEWHAAEHEYSKWLAADSGKDLRVDMTPIHFEDPFHFQLALDVVSLGVLLGEGDALRQIAHWMASARGTDMLFEYLLSPAVSDPRHNTDFFHVRPYDPLIDAFYTARTPEESGAFVKTYLEGWYQSFKGVPWHDGHLKATDEYIPYYGYWSFEAAAVCVIHGIDDASFRDHMVYPKDLADWARKNQSVARLKPLPKTPTLVKTGQPAPHSGIYAAHDGLAAEINVEQGDPLPQAEDLMDPARALRAFTWILRQRKDIGPVTE